MDSWYHLEIKNISRSNGSNLAKTLSYDLNIKLKHNGRIVDKTKDRKGEEIHIETNIPKKHFKSVQVFIDRVEEKEKRVDARVAKRIIHSLPHGLKVSEHKKILSNFHSWLKEEYNIFSFSAIHDVNEINTHAHTTLTTRPYNELTGKFENKNRALDQYNFVTKCREKWAFYLNEVLDDKGRERVTHESYKKLGIDKIAKKKIYIKNGWYSKTDIEENKKIGDLNEEIYGIYATKRRIKKEIRKINRGMVATNNSKWREMHKTIAIHERIAEKNENQCNSEKFSDEENKPQKLTATKNKSNDSVESKQENSTPKLAYKRRRI